MTDLLPDLLTTMWGIKLRLFRIDADPLVLSRDEDRAVHLESTATIRMWFCDQLSLFDYNYVYELRVGPASIYPDEKKKKEKETRIPPNKNKIIGNNLTPTPNTNTRSRLSGMKLSTHSLLPFLSCMVSPLFLPLCRGPPIDAAKTNASPMSSPHRMVRLSIVTIHVIPNALAKTGGALRIRVVRTIPLPSNVAGKRSPHSFPAVHGTGVYAQDTGDGFPLKDLHSVGQDA